MSKHSPGPWHVSDIDAVNPRIDGPDGRGIAHATQRDAHPVIGQGITPGQALANAHLIAAAPDLLEALKRLLAIADEYDLPLSDPERIAARAAIAKAQGSEP